jgi:rod shape-determining protein MreD
VIRAAVIGLLVFTAALLQTSVFPHLTLAGFRPDLLLLVTAAFGFRDGPLTGTLTGFAAGLLNDLLLVEPVVGLSAVVYLMVGYAVGVVRPYLAIGSVTAPVAVTFAATAVATAGYGLLSRLLGDARYTIDLVLQAALVIALYNTLLVPVAFPVVTRLSSRFPPERSAL